MSEIAVAAVLAGVILLASTVSVEVGISVALIELLLGVVVGNALNVDIPSWLTFVGSFAGIVLTFLAGAEVTYRSFDANGNRRCRLVSSIFAPFAVVGLLLLRTHWCAGGPRPAGSRSRHPCWWSSTPSWSRPALTVRSLGSG